MVLELEDDLLGHPVVDGSTVRMCHRGMDCEIGPRSPNRGLRDHLGMCTMLSKARDVPAVDPIDAIGRSELREEEKPAGAPP